MAKVTPAGIVTRSLGEILEELRGRVRKSIGQDVALDDETPFGQLLGIMSLELAQLEESIVANGNSMSVYNSEGIQLDDHLRLTGIARKEGTPSTVNAVVTGVVGTVIPKFSRAKTRAGEEFESTEEITLSLGDNDLPMRSIKTGPIQAAEGTLRTIVNLVPGWETINNLVAATLGTHKESDSSVKNVHRTKTSRVASSTSDSIKAALLEAGATTVEVIENDKDVFITEQGFHLFPNSLLIIVDGGESDLITSEILRVKNQGVGLSAIIRGGDNDTVANIKTEAATSSVITWNGVARSSVDISSETTLQEIATVIQTSWRASNSPDLNRNSIFYRFPDAGGQFNILYPWSHNYNPTFGDSDFEVSLGIDPASSTASPGPFIRPTERSLSVTASVTLDEQFPSDGLNEIKSNLQNVVSGYRIGKQPWKNDFLVAIERVSGTRCTAITVQDGTIDVNSVNMPVDAKYNLPLANIEITVS